MIIPNHIQIETVNGLCTASCNMCTISNWKRDPNIMDNITYIKILKNFLDYQQNIKYITLHGCGEPLLDDNLSEKIKIAKEMNFSGIGFATNCTELSEDISCNLIESGLDTIICSIDGIKKDTHESIRKGTNFEKVVSNVLKFIQLRNRIGKTKILIRFIRQEINNQEWPEFFSYWTGKLDCNFGDQVIRFDIHNWGDKLTHYKTKDVNSSVGFNKVVCEYIYDRIVVYSNGDMGFCCADDNGFFNLGNVSDCDPISIYNNNPFNYYRKMMQEGRIDELEHCRYCTIPRSRALRL
ncbi:tungsten-containing aldehyde ferredoxin oxidored uctase cofactor modifying protein [Desulfocucumis palustris]|uniref:Tungsten-containing aldehyde ferredoxin oxidored uctase cofactor modifying protein n=1 Tax=Desulfocucumis palustris TaxID=1898651 RepID=A0A2L2X803_9FIRM|nr:radical SAM/SPASM domain-containing protein [Desulfocucumis palustris]GBF32295.1 tungsten-containing aldehyde ferredoxin oxidored uctase cofactor modifying protein [Desulfocucumis palustris]